MNHLFETAINNKSFIGLLTLLTLVLYFIYKRILSTSFISKLSKEYSYKTVNSIINKIFIIIIVALIVTFISILINRANNEPQYTPLDESDFQTYMRVNYKSLLDTNNIDNEELIDFGRNFIHSKEFKMLEKSFTIPDELLKKDPHLLYLILFNRSLKEKNEKQDWMFTYTKMSEIQKNKLKKILIKSDYYYFLYQDKYNLKIKESKEKKDTIRLKRELSHVLINMHNEITKDTNLVTALHCLVDLDYDLQAIDTIKIYSKNN